MTNQCVALSLVLVAFGPAGAPPATPRPEFAYAFTLAPEYVPDAWMSDAERFPAGASVHLVMGGKRRRIAPDFAFSADPAVSYDGKRLLFAGRAISTGPLQIWEADLSGGPPTQITACATDCISPLYLPDGRVVCTRRLKNGTVVEAIHPGRGPAQALTFAPGWYMTDDVLRDGRILLSVAQPAAREGGSDLYTIHPDGTGFEAFRSDHTCPRERARQLSSGDVVFEHRGRLGVIRFGSAAQTELLQEPGDTFGPAAEAAPGWLVFSHQPNGTRTRVLCLWRSGRRFEITGPASGNAVQPVTISRRTPPRELPSGLADSISTGNMLCLNARQTGEHFHPAMDRVRAYGLSVKGEPLLLGETKLYPDGSFFVQVAGDRPIRFEVVDPEGQTVRSQKSWIWLRAGEQRVCSGCHEGPERAIENRLPDALRLGPDPVAMQGASAPGQ